MIMGKLVTCYSVNSRDSFSPTFSAPGPLRLSLTQEISLCALQAPKPPRPMLPLGKTTYKESYTLSPTAMTLSCQKKYFEETLMRQ